MYEEDNEDERRLSRKHQVLYNIRQTLKREEIMTFVSGLHDLQMDMIEITMASKERQGFPEASAVIRHIMEKK
jgi:hypothetical protein